MILTRLVLLLLLCSASVYAHDNYTGRSGAPGRTTCAASCHGLTPAAGTIAATGFPSNYTPNQTYLISLSHGAGGQIVNFNASCRVGAGTTNAGVIAAGTGTATYNVSGETNGIHFSTSYQDAGTFNWTAPPAGTGSVKLYLAGLQTGYDGDNTTLVLMADKQSAPPPAPQALVVRVDSGLVFLSWTAVSGATGYQVYRSAAADIAPALLGSSVTPAFIDSTALSLPAGKSYYVVTATAP